jgi:hypothetical protein
MLNLMISQCEDVYSYLLYPLVPLTTHHSEDGPALNKP